MNKGEWGSRSKLSSSQSPPPRRGKTIWNEIQEEVQILTLAARNDNSRRHDTPSSRSEGQQPPHQTAQLGHPLQSYWASHLLSEGYPWKKQYPTNPPSNSRVRGLDLGAGPLASSYSVG
mmetsp:Transcript_14713/g.34025  ORF Transcript_14713/g.34025 Transcript_14713/m.34025 type:complete len:119 (+) Transcript_14713:1634-1990(+)